VGGVEQGATDQCGPVCRADSPAAAGSLATLVVAATVSIDLALKQDDKGFSVFDLIPW
jgi:hypothetical protein